MTSYRLFPSTNGPALSGGGATYSGNYIPGVLWKPKQGGCWFEGYWWWVAPGAPTAPQKFCLWSVGFPSGGGTLIPAATVTSGTLTAGQWNYVPAPAPVPVAIGSTYCACTGVNGPFPEGPGQFSSTGTYSAGITNGPLEAFSDTGGTAPEPYGHAQGVFSTAGSDPAVTLPLSGNFGDNLWIDLQVSDTGPGGTVRLWPNKSDASSNVQIDQNKTFVLATEVHLSTAATSANIWFFSPSGAASLPTWCGLYKISGQSLVAANTSPSWLTPSGGAAAAGGGWCKAAFAQALPAGQYKVAVYNANGAAGSWSPTTYGYWTGTAPGASGITSGVLSAPPMAAASSAYVYFNNPGATPPFTDGSTQEPSQGSFSQTGPQYPYVAVDYTVAGTPGPPGAIAECFWVDLEVTGPVLTGTRPSFTAGRVVTARGTRPRSASRTVTAARAAIARVTRHRSATMPVTVTVTASASHSGASHPAGARPALAVTALAVATAVRHRISGRTETVNISAAARVTRHRSATRPVTAAVTARGAVPGGSRGAARPVAALVTARAAHSTRRTAASQFTAAITARAVRTVPNAPALPATAPVATLTAETERTGGPG